MTAGYLRRNRRWNHRQRIQASFKKPEGSSMAMEGAPGAHGLEATNVQLLPT